jgi:hypothetical protein
VVGHANALILFGLHCLHDAPVAIGTVCWRANRRDLKDLVQTLAMACGWH